MISADHLLVGEVAHIKAASKGGPRYDARQTDEERRSVENLLLLCHEHHVTVDELVAKYPVHKLRAMKRRHEKSAARFKVPDAIVERLAIDLDEYWRSVEQQNRQKVDEGIPIVSVRRPKNAMGALRAISQLVDLVRDAVRELDLDVAHLPTEISAFLRKLGYDPSFFEAVPYYENPFEHRLLITRMYRLPNLFIDLELALKQAEILVLQREPGNSKSLERKLRRARAEFARLATTTVYVE